MLGLDSPSQGFPSNITQNPSGWLLVGCTREFLLKICVCLIEADLSSRLGWLLALTSSFTTHVVLHKIWPKPTYPESHSNFPVTFEYLGYPRQGIFDDENWIPGEKVRKRHSPSDSFAEDGKGSKSEVNVSMETVA